MRIKIWLLTLAGLLIIGCSGSGYDYKTGVNERVSIPNEVSRGFINTAERMASHLMTHYAIANANTAPIIIVNAVNNQTGKPFDIKAYKEKLLNALNSKSGGKAKFIESEGLETADFSLTPVISNLVPDKIEDNLRYYNFSLKLVTILTGNAVWGDQQEFSRIEIRGNAR